MRAATVRLLTYSFISEWLNARVIIRQLFELHTQRTVQHHNNKCTRTQSIAQAASHSNIFTAMSCITLRASNYSERFQMSLIRTSVQLWRLLCVGGDTKLKSLELFSVFTSELIFFQLHLTEHLSTRHASLQLLVFEWMSHAAKGRGHWWQKMSCACMNAVWFFGKGFFDMWAKITVVVVYI